MKPSMKTLLWSITVAMYAVGGMIGGVSAGYWANRYGRFVDLGSIPKNDLGAETIVTRVPHFNLDLWRTAKIVLWNWALDLF